MKPQPNPHLKAAIMEVLENQLQANDPPEVKATLVRLMKAGYSMERAKEMIGSALVKEIWTIPAKKENHDLKRYVKALNSLK